MVKARYFLLALVTVAVLGFAVGFGIGTFAEEEPPTRETVEARFDRLDRDNDGKLEGAEVRPPGLLEKADTDGDRALTEAEVQAYFAERRGEAEE